MALRSGSTETIVAASVFQEILREQSVFLAETTKRITRGLLPSDVQQYKKLVFLDPKKSVMAGVKVIIQMLDLVFNPQTLPPALKQHIPFLLEGMAYSEEEKKRLVGRFIKEYLHSSLRFIEDNRTQLFAVEPRMEKELYKILADSLILDFGSRTTIRLQKYWMDQQKAEMIGKLYADIDTVFTQIAFVLEDLLPKTYMDLFAFTVFISAYAEHSIQTLSACIESKSVCATLGLLVIYGLEAYAHLPKSMTAISMRFALFCELLDQRAFTGKEIRQDFLYPIIWRPKNDLQKLHAYLQYFFHNDLIDKNQFIAAVLQQTNKSNNRATTEYISTKFLNGQTDLVIHELANYIHMASARIN